MLQHITLYQFFFSLIAIFFLLNGILKFAKGRHSQTFFKLLANTLIWGSIGLFALFPKMTHLFSEKLGFGESLNTFIFIGFIIVFMILFKVITIIERIERNISEIVRKEALDKLPTQR